MAMRNAFENMALDSSVKAIGTNPAAPLYIAPGSAGAVGQNRFRLASTGRVALTVAGSLRALVVNQANTDDGVAINKTVQILRLASYSTNTGWAQLYINPTTGLPGVESRRPKMNALMMTGTTAAPTAPSTSDPIDIRVDTNTTVALSGGTDTGVTFGIPGGARTTLDLPPFVLTPGQSLGVNVPYAGAADVSISLYWVVV